MEEFLDKKYLMVSEENFEEYLAYIGLGYIKRKIAVNARPVQCLTRNEDGMYKFSVRVALFDWSIEFRPGVEFDAEKPEDGKYKGVVTFDGNVMTHRQHDHEGRISVHVVEFFPAETVVTTTMEGTDIVAKRIYKLVK